MVYEFYCGCGCSEKKLPMAERNEPQFCDACGEFMVRRTIPSSMQIVIPESFQMTWSDIAPTTPEGEKDWKENARRK